MKRSSVITGLKVLVTLGAIVALASRVDLREIGSTLLTFPVALAPVLVLLLAAILSTSALKWKMVLRGLGRNVPLSQLVRLLWIGLFFNTFLPGRTGGDVVRAYALAKSDAHGSRAVASVAIDRILNLLALVVIGAVAVSFSDSVPGHLAYTLRVLAALALLSVTLVVVCRKRLQQRTSGRLHKWLSPILEADWSGNLIKASCLAMLGQTAMILLNVCAAHGLGTPVTTAELFIAIPLTAIVTTLPVSINGYGVREAAYATTLSFFGASLEQGVALSLVMTGTLVVWSLIGGLVYATTSLTTDSDTPQHESPSVPGMQRTVA